MKTWIQHGLLGNDATETQVGFNRGGLLLAVLGVLDVLLIFVPGDPQQKLAIIAALNPTVGFASYVLFALLDKWLKDRDIEP